MTVPALGCPEVWRWDLTRHWLSSLPYSPGTGADRALILRGERGNMAADFLCFIQPSFKMATTFLFPIQHMQTAVL